ncbi:MAG: flagellar hook-basal body complex protein FliE [Alphaproteobacteria bacterium]|nr:flagellar hook-basal body complex protein FliE [Alphaproteobacteria bacterium]
MVTNALGAISAYKKSGGMADSVGGPTKAGSATGGDFSSMVTDFLGNAVDSLKEGEKAATAAVTGKADLASVVTAMDNAEIVLTEITAIRDKVIAAYQSITSSSI